jgi:3-oxoacyl-[acyl-carrier protein] reductase
LQVDVASGASLDAFRAAIDRRFDAVDILVNSVGTTRFVAHADLNGLDDGLIDDIFRTNWRGPFATIRALQPLLARNQNGLVVNISSVAATTGIGSNVAYCASKAALNAMTVSLARALAPAIRVVSVSPGVVETGFISGLDQGWRDEQAKRTPMGRFASPDDVGAAVLATATTLAYSTGCIIPVDGGRPLW